MADYYSSPRITGEFLDCSMPMTFDQYSNCGYNCLYCFSTFQRGVGSGAREYWLKKVKQVNFEKFKRLFEEPEKNRTFAKLVENKIVLQWGGLSDPFCTLEEEFGLGYKILEYLNSIDYPCRFSSKTDLFLRNEKYFDLIKQKPHLWFYMCSIITTDEEKAKKIEGNVPSPQRRFENLKKLSSVGIKTMLRLRPFIIGLSDRTLEDLIAKASWAGCYGVSTEFFCLETRITPSLMQKYNDMSKIIGFDIFKYYKKASTGAGYLRLNYEIKRKYVDKMVALCDKYGLKFFCSDANHKEKSMGGSCCGLPMDDKILGNYNKCQFTEALMIAKKNPDHTVKFSDIADNDVFLKDVSWNNAEGMNTGNTHNREKYKNYSMLDFMRHAWNNTKSQKSPYRYFGGILYPVGKDDRGDLIYKLDDVRSKMTERCMSCDKRCQFAGRKAC